MRIVENSPDRLVLRDRTALMSVLLLGGAALMAAVWVRTPGQPGLLAAAAFFALGGLIFLRTSAVIFDKGQRACFVRRRDVFKVSQTSVPFADIRNVRLDTSTGGEWNTPTWRLTLMTAGGDLPLSAVFEAGQPKYEAMREALVETIFDSRSRPATPDPVDGLMASGRYVDATAFLRRRDSLGLTEAKARVDALRKLRGV